MALSTVAIPISAQATVMSVKVDYTAPYGTFGGRDYVYVEATMKGNFTRADASAGTYSVPIVLINADGPGNGFGVVDVPNTVYLVLYNFEMCGRPPSLAPGLYTHLWCGNGEGGLRLANQIYPLAWQSTEHYLFEQGYTYMAVQWDREVVWWVDNNASDGHHPPTRRIAKSHLVIRLTTAYGTTRTRRNVRALVAIGGKADLQQRRAGFAQGFAPPRQNRNSLVAALQPLWLRL
jgi:hypothetical protein